MTILFSLGVVSAVFVCIYVALLCYFNQLHKTPLFFDHKKKNRPRLISGYIPYLGVVASFSKRPYDYIQSLREQYKEDVFTVYVMGKFMTFVCHPKDVANVFSSPKNFEMHELALEISAKIFGIRKKTLDLEDVSDAAFKMITKYLMNDDLPTMTTKAQHKLESCLLNDPVPVDCDGWREQSLEKFAARLISDASTFALFGDSLPYDELLEDFKAFDDQVLLLGSDLPNFLKTQAFAHRKKYIDLFKAPMAENASKLIKERTELYKEVADDDDTAAAVMIISWVSLTNTIGSTFWALYHLLKLPEKYRLEIIEEAKEVLKEVEHLKKPDSLLPPLDHEMLNRMPKLEALIDEALRVSALNFVARRATGNVKFTDHKGNLYKFTKYEHMMIVPSHKDEEVFDNPSEFQPYRFLNKNERKWTKNGESIKLSGAHVVFGGGIHQCPGRFFAKNEMKLIACVLLQTLDFQLVSKEEAIPDEKKAGLVFVTSKNEIKVKYRLRK